MDHGGVVIYDGCMPIKCVFRIQYVVYKELYKELYSKDHSE